MLRKVRNMCMNAAALVACAGSFEQSNMLDSRCKQDTQAAKKGQVLTQHIICSIKQYLQRTRSNLKAALAAVFGLSAGENVLQASSCA